MKITKRQLRRLIREEKRKLLREGQAQEEALFDALDQYVMVLDEEMGYDVPQEKLKAAVYEFGDQYFKDQDYAAKAEQFDENRWDSGDQENWENTQRAAGYGDIE